MTDNNKQFKVTERRPTRKEARAFGLSEAEYAHSLPAQQNPDPYAKTQVYTRDGLIEEIEYENRSKGMKKFQVNAVKIISVDDKEYPLERREPYGFWYVIGLEADLGTFTGHKEATEALLAYLRKQHAKD
ncbi:MAG TPA: hypothetical protein VGE97_02800 [Nitrososphaera sp.]|jgi:hypothetical protein